MLYENQEYPEIHSISNLSNEILSKPSDSEWCQNEVMVEDIGVESEVDFDTNKGQDSVINNTRESQSVKEPDKNSSRTF